MFYKVTDLRTYSSLASKLVREGLAARAIEVAHSSERGHLSDPRKIAVKSFGGLTVGRVGLVLGVEHTEPVRLPVGADRCAELSAARLDALSATLRLAMFWAEVAARRLTQRLLPGSPSM